MLNKFAPRDTRGSILTPGYVGEIFLVLRGSTFRQRSGECHDLQRKQIKINFLKIKCTNRHNYAAMIPSEAGKSG